MGLKILAENDVQLVISDHRMPNMSGIEFFATVNEKYPDVIRIILTGYTHVDSIAESINKGHVYKFLLKPWNDQNLKLEITQALEHYDLIQANKRLHETVLERNEALKGINENLEALVKDRTRELEIKNHALELSQAILEDLPLPIIGVSSEGTIVLINREVQSLSNQKDSIVIGKGLLDCFPGGVKEMLDRALETNSSQGIRQCCFSGATYDIDCIPLLGRFKGKGAILTLKPAK